MAEEAKDTDVDIFQTLKKTNESLIEYLDKAQQQQQQQQPTYVQPAAPEPARPNYVMYAAIGLLALVLLRKVKL